jgi:shikimate dehydrogenase
MLLLAVIGNPIKHSLSPQIHQQFAKQYNINLCYDKIYCENDIAPLIKAFSQTHLGCNITAPYKIDAYNLSDELTDNAIQAQAVNTLKFCDHKIIGHNTDGLGLVTDLNQNLNQTLANKTILIIGAGGAARGIMAPLLQQNVKQIFITNRTYKKAQQLAKTFYSIGEVFAIKQLSRPVDIIINTTPLTVTVDEETFDTQWLHDNTIGYDLTYATTTPFLSWLEQHAIQHYNGLGMLVEQAAESFYFWFGVKPGTQHIKL